ncbi:MAG: M23 family metallopeptidase [Candidatus Moranbacteria bacterium]|nr:M23 family metallopeptidase [Candidatus Moranbacteria bacterium]NTW46372.1 M23 family metallopeptidase [Candidatus Moranbacteria bacterium]
MAYPIARDIVKPLDPYMPIPPRFGRDVASGGIDRGIHLGEDVAAKVGTPVRCVARGRVVYSAVHPGSEEKGNWGGIVIVGHRHPVSRKAFFSLYGHLGVRTKEKGDRVDRGEVLGTIGPGFTPENGWWEEHLHFAVYAGEWKGGVLPGYFRPDSRRTDRADWIDPRAFFDDPTRM